MMDTSNNLGVVDKRSSQTPVFGNLVLSPDAQAQALARQAEIQQANLTAAERKRQRRQERNLRCSKATTHA
jgi:hypothetical protein